MINYSTLISLKKLTTNFIKLERSFLPKLRSKKVQKGIYRLHLALKNLIHFSRLNSLELQIVEQIVANQILTIVNKGLLNYTHFTKIKRHFHESLQIIQKRWGNVSLFIRIKINPTFGPQNQKILFKYLAEFCDKKTRMLINQLLSRQKKIIFSSHKSFSTLITDLYFEFFDNQVTLKNVKKEKLEYLPTFSGVNAGNQKQLDKSVYKKPEVWLLRYKREILIGLQTSFAKASSLKAELELFLTEKLKVKLDKKETYLSTAERSNNYFLGYLVKKNYSRLNNSDRQKFSLKAPVNRLLELLCSWGYAKFKNRYQIQATVMKKVITKTDTFIFEFFKKKIHQFQNFYNLACNQRKLGLLVKIYKISCILTLAKKHKIKKFKTSYLKYKRKLKFR